MLPTKLIQNSSIYSSPICKIIQHLYRNSSILRLFYIAQTFGAFISLGALSFGMLQLCTKQATQLPLSSLLMMLNLCVALLLANVGVALSALYNIHVPLVRTQSSHCYWLSFSFIDCLAIRTLLNLSLFATYMAGACLALERMAGSLLYIRRTKNKRAISIFLIILQWLISVLVTITPSLTSSSNLAMFSPHCSLLTPSPTQMRPLFFAILGIHALVLSIYSILTYHHHFDPQIALEMSRQNPFVLEQIYATEQTLPAAATTVGLFILSTLLDRQFLLALAKSFGFEGIEKMDERSMLLALNNRHKRPDVTIGLLVDGIFNVAFWSEFQVYF
jgi:hypothetical protein